jgi:hypothetical protein
MTNHIYLKRCSLDKSLYFNLYVSQPNIVFRFSDNIYDYHLSAYNSIFSYNLCVENLSGITYNFRNFRCLHKNILLTLF